MATLNPCPQDTDVKSSPKGSSIIAPAPENLPIPVAFCTCTSVPFLYLYLFVPFFFCICSYNCTFWNILDVDLHSICQIKNFTLNKMSLILYWSQSPLRLPIGLLRLFLKSIHFLYEINVCTSYQAVSYISLSI